MSAGRAPPGEERELPIERLSSTAGPMLLAELHRAMGPGTSVRLVLTTSDRPVPPALETRVRDVVEGGGFSAPTIEPRDGALVVRTSRVRSLADTVGPDMRLLVCGLNPSLPAADAGVGYAGPSNRFWPAIGKVVGAAPLDASALLAEHQIGMTDLVKRATAAASSLTADEYRAGVERVTRLVGWLAPGAVCFVGLAGWRAAIDRRAVPGEQPKTLASRPVYVMPSTSGRNAHTTSAELAEHLQAALALASDRPRSC